MFINKHIVITIYEYRVLHDHGVRKYDEDIGRFTSVDPLWSKYIGWTPYQYCGNDPINASDGNGAEPLGCQSTIDNLTWQGQTEEGRKFTEYGLSIIAAPIGIGAAIAAAPAVATAGGASILAAGLISSEYGLVSTTAKIIADASGHSDEANKISDNLGGVGGKLLDKMSNNQDNKYENIGNLAGSLFSMVSDVSLKSPLKIISISSDIAGGNSSISNLLTRKQPIKNPYNKNKLNSSTQYYDLKSVYKSEVQSNLNTFLGIPNR